MDGVKQNNLAGNIIIFFILLFVFAKWGPAIPFNISSQSRGEPLVVVGEGRVSVAPDIAKITFGVEENGVSLKSVQDSVNKKSQALVRSLEKAGIDEKDIKTSSYSLYPNYDFNLNPSRIIGYRVSTQYEATVRDFEKVNEVIVVITEAGANLVGSVSFEINDETKNEKLNEARKEAVEEAKEKAEGLAKAAGISLGKIVNISESQGIDYPRTLMLEKSGLAIDGTEPATPPSIQPGETELSVTLSLSYEVK